MIKKYKQIYNKRFDTWGLKRDDNNGDLWDGPDCLKALEEAFNASRKECQHGYGYKYSDFEEWLKEFMEINLNNGERK